MFTLRRLSRGPPENPASLGEFDRFLRDSPAPVFWRRYCSFQSRLGQTFLLLRVIRMEVLPAARTWSVRHRALMALRILASVAISAFFVWLSLRHTDVRSVLGEMAS